jgi:hypothetical protein
MAKQAKKIPPAAHVAEDLLWGGWNTCTIAAAVELDLANTHLRVINHRAVKRGQ